MGSMSRERERQGNASHGGLQGHWCHVGRCAGAQVSAGEKDLVGPASSGRSRRASEGLQSLQLDPQNGFSQQQSKVSGRVSGSTAHLQL